MTAANERPEEEEEAEKVRRRRGPGRRRRVPVGWQRRWGAKEEKAGELEAAVHPFVDADAAKVEAGWPERRETAGKGEESDTLAEGPPPLSLRQAEVAAGFRALATSTVREKEEGKPSRVSASTTRPSVRSAASAAAAAHSTPTALTHQPFLRAGKGKGGERERESGSEQADCVRASSSASVGEAWAKEQRGDGEEWSGASRAWRRL